MRPPLLEAINQRLLVANGAMGSMLAARGLRLANSTQANTAAPQVVREILAAYRAAGATVLQSNTFTANETMLAAAGLADQHDELNRRGLRLAREAGGDDCYVAANLGPTGELLQPLGTMTPQQATEVFRRQAEVLLAAEPDFFLLETFEALDELAAAVSGVRAAGSNLPLALTFSFSRPNVRSMMGVGPAEALATMTELGADIVGANCGLPEATVAAIKEMAPLTDLPLMMQANAGIPELRDGETHFGGTPEQSAALAREAVQAGARIIGGCCGTTPHHIAAIVAALGAQ